MTYNEPLQPDSFYHLYNHANGTENLCKTKENYRFFLQQYGLFTQEVLDSYAYCLMPNHFHFLVKVKSEESLASFWMKKFPNKTLQGHKPLEELVARQLAHFFNSYTQSFNKMFDRKGSLFMPRFKRKRIESDLYLTRVVHYIHANPVHHGFVKEIHDWPYSSYHAFLSSKPTKLQREYVLHWFGGVSGSEEFHKQKVDPKWMMELEL